MFLKINFQIPGLEDISMYDKGVVFIKWIKMKTCIYKMLILLGFIAFINVQCAFSQKDVTSKISYEVDSGPVFPIQGESIQIKGVVNLDDDTGDIKSLSFQVPLLSFTGSHADYLAWLGNARSNPYFKFNSTSVSKNENNFEVNGQLEFRRRFRPITIDLVRENTEGEIILMGNFQLSTSDFFVGPTPAELVAPWIPFKFTLVFDEAKEGEKTSIKAN